MNPPYGRVRLDTADRERFASILYGHANLYGLFLGAALDSLDPVDGVLAALVPTSFTSGLYFQNLRAELSRAAPLREAAFVADRGGVFAGVLRETCLAVFTRRRSRRTDITAMSGEVRSSVARVPTPRGSGPWLLPRHSADAPAAAAASVMPLTLRAAGWNASTGPLVWNRRRADLDHEPGPDRVRIVWAADLDGGVLHQDPARDSYRYLRLSKPSDPKVMVLNEPCVLVQRTTAPEQRRRLLGVELDEAALDGRVVVENHVNVLRPRTGEPRLIGHRLVAHLLASSTLGQASSEGPGHRHVRLVRRRARPGAVLASDRRSGVEPARRQHPQLRAIIGGVRPVSPPAGLFRGGQLAEGVVCLCGERWIAQTHSGIQVGQGGQRGQQCQRPVLVGVEVAPVAGEDGVL